VAIIAHRIRGEANGLVEKTASPDRAVEAYLAEALGTTLDNLAVGVIIVAEGARILHANAAARRMLEARSPVVSLGGCLGALDAELTKELQRAIAAARSEGAHIGDTGIGVPLTDKDMTAAAAHVLPLARGDARQRRGSATAAVVFVARANMMFPVDVGTVARIYRLTPAETRVLQHLVAGASLTEAATALGVSETTAKTHRNHIFLKKGVSRRTDLFALIGRLVPPIRRAS
jgi:DNA-binding CsgD family transcriptional regulator